MLTTIITGEVDLADVLLLVAFIVFAVMAIIAVMHQTVEGALLPVGLVTLALLVL